jgi:PhnB protein
MVAVNPYLNFPGNTEDAFNFYRSVFGGDFVMLQRFKETAESAKIPAADQDKIMHIALPLSNGSVLMGTDALESMGQKLNKGDNFSLCISASSKDEADMLFGKLSDGGIVTMPMMDMFWGAYFGMVTDKFGIQWMMSFDARYV